MSSTSLEFIVLMCIAFILCWSFKGRLKTIALLILNTAFALTFAKKHFIYLVVLVVICWLFGRYLQNRKNKIVLLGASFFVIFGMMVAKLVGLIPAFSSWTVPVGISFYTFRMVSYLCDVYKGKVNGTRSLVDVYCYASFFPVFVAGPIHRAESFFQQLHEKREFDYLTAKNGAVLCAFGMFEKMVFSDYIASITNHVFSNEVYGLSLVVGLILYSFQIYLDFDSYSNIAIGAAQCLGFKLSANFKTPYLAYSLNDFWRRWHISLSSWFRDYVYIPLGGNRKGTIRKYVNLLTVFLLSGLWHGLSLNFVIWGLGHGLIRILQDKIHWFQNKGNAVSHVIKIILNFAIVTVLWVFFRSADFEEAIMLFKRCLTSTPFQLSDLGINIRQLIWLIIVLAMTIMTDLLRNSINMIEWMSNQPFFVRWFIYILLIAVFIVFGMYGSGYNPQDFIYIQF